MMDIACRRNISPATFDKDHAGKGTPRSKQQHLALHQHRSSSSSIFPNFELPLGTIPEKMNFASLPPPHPPPPTHSGIVSAAHNTQTQLQLTSSTGAPVNFDQQLATTVSSAYPFHHSTATGPASSLHQHHQFEVIP